MKKKRLLEHYAQADLVSDPEWEMGMEVSVKFIAKLLAKMKCGAAMAEENFSMPPGEHFVFGAFDKLYTGEWEWNPHSAVHSQIIKIALSDIHHYLDSWKKREHPIVVEVDERLADRLTEDTDFMDVVYEIAEKAVNGDKDLLDYLKAMRRCDDYELIGEELGIPIQEVYQRQRKLMRRLEKRKKKTK
jgi:hypothetical protein